MLIVGQVLWLRTVLNVRGTVSSGEHPYLIYKIDEINRRLYSLIVWRAKREISDGSLITLFQ